jgi:hypothetical protein
LFPDLVTKEPERFSIVTSNGERRLRLDNEVGNRHTGPLELVAAGTDSDCNGVNGVEPGERVAFQRAYQDANGDGFFSRSTDTTFTDTAVGCFAYHAAHGHVHFENFARYELRKLTNGASDGPVVAWNAKVTFCIADVRRFAGSIPGSPSSAYYTNCNGIQQGLSVGWSDEYPYHVSGQHIAINPGGVYIGDSYYCLVSIADPGLILEEENGEGNAEANNVASVRIRLRSNGRRVSTYRGTSCGGVGPESWGS